MPGTQGDIPHHLHTVYCQRHIGFSTVEAKARELLAEYQSDGQRCDSDCVPVDARCVSSLCTAVQK